MNEELKIIISAEVDKAKQSLKNVKSELGRLEDQLATATEEEKQLTAVIKRQESQLQSLQSQYTKIVNTQGKESAAAVACARQIGVLTASYGTNLIAQRSAMASSAGYRTALLELSGMGGYVRTTELATANATRKTSDAMDEASSSTGVLATSAKKASDTLKNTLHKTLDELYQVSLALEYAFDDAVDEFGEGSDMANIYAGAMEAVNRATDPMVDTLQKIRASEPVKEINKLGDAFEGLEEAVEKAFNQMEMFPNIPPNNALTRGIKDLKRAFKEAKEEAKNAQASLQDYVDTAQTAGEVGNRVLKGMATAALAGATALMALGQSTKDYRQEQAMLKTAFETSGSSAEVAKQTYNDLYRVLGESDQATEAAQQLAKLTNNEKELSEWTKICQGVYGTFGKSLPVESLAEAVNHSAKLGEVQGTLADALEWSGITVDEFNEQLFWCNTESEREKLIRDTLNGLYSEAAENYEANASSIMAQNEAQLQLTDAMAQLGEVTEPIMVMLTQMATDILGEMAPDIKDFAEKYAPDIKNALEKIGDFVGKILGFIFENWDIVSTLAIVIGAISAALSVFATVMGIVNAVMLASPITWIVLAIVAAVAALVAIIIVVIQHWDKIKAVAIKVWEAVKNAVKTAIDAIVGFFKKIINFVKENWQGLLLLIANPFAGAFKLAYDNCEGFRKKVDTFLGKLKDAFKKGIDFIKKLFKFDFELPKIKVPKFSIKPDGWAIGDLLKGIKPTLDITWNARGGVFDKPTLFGYGSSLQGIGENGAEAVVPLENNTEWLDKIATRLAASLSGDNKPIILQVDGKTFAKTAVSSINSLTRQQGRLSLNIV